jgi:hypothetical protein
VCSCVSRFPLRAVCHRSSLLGMIAMWAGYGEPRDTVRRSKATARRSSLSVHRPHIVEVMLHPHNAISSRIASPEGRGWGRAASVCNRYGHAEERVGLRIIQSTSEEVLHHVNC